MRISLNFAKSFASSLFVTITATSTLAFAKEDIQILTDLLQGPIAQSQPALERAKLLKPSPLEPGQKIDLARCQKIETAIATNYKLHGYKSEDGVFHLGVKLCPPTTGAIALFDSEWMFPESTALYFTQKSVSNSFGIQGTSVLTVSYTLDNERVTVKRQYLLNASSQILQFDEVRTDKGYKFWTIRSAVDETGNVLSKTEKHWRNPNEPFIWKKSVAFASANGAATSYIYTQNDSKGAEVSMGSFSAPFEISWQAYEVSPLTRLGGIYKIADRTTTWLPKQANYHHFSNQSQTCEEGYIGWDGNGNRLREFGSAESCKKVLDIETMRF